MYGPKLYNLHAFQTFISHEYILMFLKHEILTKYIKTEILYRV